MRSLIRRSWGGRPQRCIDQGHLRLRHDSIAHAASLVELLALLQSVGSLSPRFLPAVEMERLRLPRSGVLRTRRNREAASRGLSGSSCGWIAGNSAKSLRTVEPSRGTRRIGNP